MKKMIACLLFLWAGCLSYGQAGSYAPSPDATALVNNIKNNVGYATGTVNVNIPIHSLTIGDIVLPIGLNYNTSGIKVQDMVTSVGIGWNLSAGGKITRIVKARPDEQSNPENIWFNWSYNHGYEIPFFPPTIKRTSSSSGIGGILSRKYINYDEMDAQPDMFFFEVGGLSGLFVFDHDGTPHTIPYQNIKIDWNRTNNTFTIKDDKGNTYSFNVFETSEMTAENANIRGDKTQVITYPSTWHLTEVQTLWGESIQFDYYTLPTKITYYDSYSEQYKIYKGVNEKLSREINSQNIKILEPKLIKNITWDTGKMEFEHKTSNSGHTLINQVRLYNRNTDGYYNESKTIGLFYNLLSSNHPSLNRLSEKFPSGVGTYIDFKYNTKYYLPHRGSFDYDKYGFYNGAGNSTHIPAYQTDRSVIIPGADRSPNFEYATVNILTELSYSNGMRVKYEYEPNSGNWVIIQGPGSKSDIGGVRIKSITKIAGTSYDKVSYEYGDPWIHPSYGTNYEEYYTNIENGYTATYIVLHDKPIGSNTDIMGNFILYQNVKEKFQNGSYVTYEYLPPCDDNFATPTSMPYTTSMFWRRNMLKKKTFYSANGEKDQEVIYHYNYRNKHTISCFVPYYRKWGAGNYVETVYGAKQYDWISEMVSVERIEKPQTSRSMSSVTQFEYTNDGRLRRIRGTDAAGVETSSLIKYADDYTTTSAAIAFIREHAKGLLIEAINYKNGRVLGATFNQYQYQNTNDSKPQLYPEAIYQLRLGTPSNFINETTINSNNTPIFDSRYELDISFEELGASNRVLTSVDSRGIRTAVIYGYNNSLPIAEITNAVHSESGAKNQVFYTSFESNDNAVTEKLSKTGKKVLKQPWNISHSQLKNGAYLVSYWESTSQGSSWEYIEEELVINNSNRNSSYKLIASQQRWIDEVRIHPENSFMITYSYEPGIGKTSETDVRGQTVYYEYNSIGLLMAIYDNDRNIIKKISYDNIKN